MANTITQTTLTAIMTSEAQSFTVASATNFTGPTANYLQKVYVINPDTIRGELMNVTAVNGTQISVSRLDKYRQRFLAGAIVLIAPPTQTSALFNGPYLGGFMEFDPVGGSSMPMQNNALQPWVNVDNGNQWLFSTLTNLWVTSFNSDIPVKGVTAAVASAAGLITPSGPLFHVTGTAAITGFNIPVGFSGGSFTIIPD